MTLIEVIDISPWASPSLYSEADRAAVVKQWDKAFSQVGFTAIIGNNMSLRLSFIFQLPYCSLLGHGVDLALVDQVNSSAAAFFNLDADLKQRFQTKSYGDPSVSSRFI